MEVQGLDQLEPVADLEHKVLQQELRESGYQWSQYRRQST